MEHQDKPREFLNIVKELLKDGGYIAGSVPNRESYFHRELNQKNSIIDFPPHHFLRFSDISLKNCLEIIGFKSIEVFKTDSPFYHLFPFIGKKLLGDDIKIWLKTKVLGDKRMAYGILVEDLDKASQDRLKVSILKALKFVRNAILLPFTLLYLPKLKSNGVHLYFQSKYSK